MRAESLSVLRNLGDLIQSSINELLQCDESLEAQDMPSKPLFEIQRNLLSAAGKLTELVSQPNIRILEVSSQYFEARCLHIAVDKRVPDLLETTEDAGMHVNEIAKEVGIESRKLCKSRYDKMCDHMFNTTTARILRCLCSIHIFQEVEPNTFANNRISATLVGNEPLRAYVLLL